MESIAGIGADRNVTPRSLPPEGKTYRRILAKLKAATLSARPRLGRPRQPNPTMRYAKASALTMLQQPGQPAAPVPDIKQLPTPDQITDAIEPSKDKWHLCGLIVPKRPQSYKQILNLLAQWHDKIKNLSEDIPPQEQQEQLTILKELENYCDRYLKHTGRPGTSIITELRDLARQLGVDRQSELIGAWAAPAHGEISVEAIRARRAAAQRDRVVSKPVFSWQKVLQTKAALRFETNDQLRKFALDKVKSDPRTVWFVESLEQLSALVNHAVLARGRLQRVSGPLAAALAPKSGFTGTLLLNYETIGKEPGGLSAINDLLGNPPTLCERTVQPGLCVVPLLTNRTIRPPMADVISRLGPVINGNEVHCGQGPAGVHPIADAAQLEEIKTQGALVVDFHHSPNWREFFFGRLVMDARGRRLVPSNLARHLQSVRKRQDTGAAKRVVLKNMPADPELHRMVDQLLCDQPVHFLGMELGRARRGLFPRQLPQFFRFEGYTETELNALADTAAAAAVQKEAGSGRAMPWVLNAQNFHSLYNELTIPRNNTGELIVHGLADRFRQKPAEHTRLHVNSNLSAGQWVELLELIRQVNSRNPNQIALQIEADVQLPETFDFLKCCQTVPNGLDNLPQLTASVQSLVRPKDDPDLLPWILRGQGMRRVRCADETLAAETIRTLCKQDRQPVVFADIMAGTRPESWWQRIEISSYNKLKLKDTADHSQIDFLTALRAGTPIVIRGLGDDPGAWASLSSLQCQPPYLVINGERREFVSANLIVLDAAQTEADTAAAKVSYHDYFIHHPEFEDVLQNRHEDFQRALDFLETLSGHAGRPFLRAAAISSLLRQVRGEMNANEPGSFKKAIDSLLLKQFRDNPERYAHFKCLNRQLWQDGYKPPFYVHTEEIARLMAGVKTKADLDGRLWQLAAQMDPALFAFPLSTCDKADLRAAVAAVVIGAETDSFRKDYYRDLFGAPTGPGRTDLLPAPPVTEADRAQRKQARLWDKIQQHPITWILGETATGKSWLSSQVVAKNNGRIVRLNAGPLTDEGDLVGRSATRPTPDGRDMCTEYVQGKLLEWINLETAGQKPAVLIVDEFNLARPGVWNALKGLGAPCGQRRIFLNGKAYPVSDRHRVVFTGNPPHYAGRHQDLFFTDYATALYFKPLAPETLKDQVIDPALDHIIDPGDTRLKRFASRLLLDFHRLFPSLDTGHAITVRDLHDILKHLSTDMASQKPAAHEIHTAGDFTLALRRAIHLSLGYLLSDSARTALDDWLYLKIPNVDGGFRTGAGFFDAQPKPPKAFDTFYTDLGNSRPDLFLNSTRLRGYVEQIHAYVGFRNAEKAAGADPAADPLPARRGLFVQAIQGTGKDLVLDACLNRLCPHDYTHITCNPHTRLGELIQAIDQAREQGKILVISEMNLMPGAFMESINDALTGACKPGFMLIATVNPDHFAGRHPISPALKSRLTQVLLPDPSAAEYLAYTQFMLDLHGMPRELAQPIVDRHIHAQRQAGFCLGFRDLTRICAVVGQQSRVPDQAALNQMVRDIYAKYDPGAFQAAKAGARSAPARQRAAVPAQQQAVLLSHEILGEPGLAPRTGVGLSEGLRDALLSRLRNTSSHRPVPGQVLQTVCALLLQQKLPGMVFAKPGGHMGDSRIFSEQMWHFFHQGLLAADGAAEPRPARDPAGPQLPPEDRKEAWHLGRELRRVLMEDIHLPLRGYDEYRFQQVLGRAAETIKSINLRQIQEQATARPLSTPEPEPGPGPGPEPGPEPGWIDRIKGGFRGALTYVLPQPSAGVKSTQLSQRLLQEEYEHRTFIPDKNLGQCSLQFGFLLEKLFSATGQPIDLTRFLATGPPAPENTSHAFTLDLERDADNQVRVYLPVQAMCGQISHVRIRDKSSPGGRAVLDLANTVFQPQYRNGKWMIDLSAHKADMAKMESKNKAFELAYTVTENSEHMSRALWQMETINPGSAPPAGTLAPKQAVLNSALYPGRTLDLSQMAGLPPFEAARQITAFLRNNYLYSLNPRIKNRWLPVFAKPLSEQLAFLNTQQKGQCAVFSNLLYAIMNTLHPGTQWSLASGRQIKKGHFHTGGHAVLLGLNQNGGWQVFDATPVATDRQDHLTQQQMGNWNSLSAAPNPLITTNYPVHPDSYKDSIRREIYNAASPQIAETMRRKICYNKVELGLMILADLKTEPRWRIFKPAAEALFEKDFSMSITREAFASEVLQSIMDMIEKHGREHFFGIWLLLESELVPLLKDGSVSLTPEMKKSFQILLKNLPEKMGENTADLGQSLPPAGRHNFLNVVRQKLGGSTTTAMVPSHLPGVIDPARLGTQTPFTLPRLQKEAAKKPVNIISVPKPYPTAEFLAELFHALEKDVRVAGVECNNLDDFITAVILRSVKETRFFLPPVQQNPEKQTLWDRHDLEDLYQAFEHERLLNRQNREADVRLRRHQEAKNI